MSTSRTKSPRQENGETEFQEPSQQILYDQYEKLQIAQQQAEQELRKCEKKILLNRKYD